MMQYKILDCVVYSDTDSLFTTDLEPFLHLIGEELGQFKNEMEGLSINNIIDRAIFLGIKQYGFQYTNKSGDTITKTVFAGVQRNSLSYDQIIQLLNGGEIKVTNKDRFFRSMSNFNIKIKGVLLNRMRIKNWLITNTYLNIYNY